MNPDDLRRAADAVTDRMLGPVLFYSYCGRCLQCGKLLRYRTHDDFYAYFDCTHFTLGGVAGCDGRQTVPLRKRDGTLTAGLTAHR